MKKKNIIIIITLIVLLIAGIVLLVTRRADDDKDAVYTVKVSLVDDKSPDRILTVYKNDKKIDYKEIRKMSGTLLCEADFSAVYFGEIKNESELKIILKNDEEVVAKIVKGE